MSNSNLVSQDPATAEATSPYNYVPTEWICITFVMLFGINTVLHISQSWKFRMWWLIPTVVVAGTLEILGWSARLWSSISPTLLTPFEIQLIGTILAPTPFLAANFLVLGKIIVRLGPQYSRLSPKLYALIFCTLDVMCLTIQAVGGAYAADEVNRNQSPDRGGNIMLLGVTLQSCAMALYVLCAGEFVLRFLSDTPVRKNSAPVPEEKLYAKIMEWDTIRWLILGLAIQTFCLFVRATYRTVELSNGWSGPIISTQAYINVFDGLMMTIALYTMNLIHPGFFLAETLLVARGVDLPRQCSASATCTTDSASMWT
ncbi:RTA1 like protein-domain-containing protein [Pisolithus croceorrhizus]|nr:RTA1 like protein-domain-containing protein [Pisolithus croceorrhizus]